MSKNKKYDPKWNFQEETMNQLSHHLHPYPAMLMPLIIRNILIKYGNGSNTVILDPYVGSGTTLVEAQYYGAKKAIGVDLNPLAILMTKAKTEIYDFDNLKNEINSFKNHSVELNYNINIREDNVHDFSIRDSWYKEKNIIELAFIKEFIEAINDQKVRLFFNVTFSEVVRNVSFTRKGEFKLYRIAKNRIDDFNPNAIVLYLETLNRNYEILKEYSKEHENNTQIIILEENAKNIDKLDGVANSIDIVITSPPYGDSHTTVAYGQFSRLANEWLGIEDANQVDNQLMGGSKKGINKDKIFNIQELDEVINKIKEYDETQKNKRYPDVISFYEDYIETINSVAKTIKLNGYAVYVVGNRRVRNIELPTDLITVRAFENQGFVHEKTIVRDIINKRMPSKTSPSNKKGKSSATMSKEYIVVMRKTV